MTPDNLAESTNPSFDDVVLVLRQQLADAQFQLMLASIKIEKLQMELERVTEAQELVTSLEEEQ